jgi:hypothetical protein
MSFVALAVGLAIAVLGVLGIAWPESLASILRHSQSTAGVYFGAGLRVVLGISLLLSARRSRTPDILRVLGVVFLVAGLVGPLLGLEFLRSGIDVFLSLGRGASAAWGVIALGLGLFIAWAVTPRSRTV